MTLENIGMKEITNMTVWLLEEHGDGDYHSGGIVGIYATEKAAKEQMVIEAAQPNRCHPQHPKCDHIYSYSIAEMKVLDAAYNHEASEAGQE